MTCSVSKQTLALHVEGDLPEAAAAVTRDHLARCEPCRTYVDELRARQSLLKSLRREIVSPSECTRMRREVMSMVNDRRHRSGWALRFERTIVLGVQRRPFAMAAFALITIVSASVFAQMRSHPGDAAPVAAVFDGRNTLVRPEGYRDWIVVDPSAERRHAPVEPMATGREGTPARKVFMNPTAYRDYARTGKFPEGTVMIWESAGETGRSKGHYEPASSLLASVKDSSRFAEGWGFFDFTARDGTAKPTAEALTEASACRACHRQDAETDHVFTQFYPALRSALHGV
jgi:Cytochrome P460